MPRRNKANLDFEIHDDNQHDPADEAAATTTDVQDFASPTARSLDGSAEYEEEYEEEDKALRGDQSTLLNEEFDEEDYKMNLPNSAVESNMTRASTLVDEPVETDVDGKIDAMLEDLGGKRKGKGGTSEADSASRRGSDVSSWHGDGESRRTSNISNGTDGLNQTDGGESVLDCEPSVDGGAEEEADTQASHSRRESAQSAASLESSGTVERTDIGSHYDEEEYEDNESMLLQQDDSQTPSRRESAMSADSGRHAGGDRRASGRTEALIHAAARDIVAKINQNRGRESPIAESVADEGSFVAESKVSSARPSDAHQSVAEDESLVSSSRVSSARSSDAHQPVADESSFVSNSRVSSARPSLAHESVVDEPHTPTLPDDGEDLPSVESRVSSARPSDVHEPADVPQTSIEDEDPTPMADEAESSSHHENEDDVFSDNSPRSSVGSLSESDHKKMAPFVTQRFRAPRISDFSRLDDYADEEEEDEQFIPTVRGTPRPPFRSPSSVKALQMSSPPPSVLGSPRSPRSSRRRTPLPTVSRLGSPSISAQYSPKKTPPRFKRATPPLVLLHATLLPLRWAWANVLEAATAGELSPEGKSLREAWRALQDRLGDTVCERGILLPHPQNDFEVLEERLLEALELPLRRRARILECGHYIGPSNEMTILEEESEDEHTERPSRTSGFVDNKTRWCSTCRSDIRLEDSLGAGKIFRVKVYASNGLMKAGAWEACWKEMERVDVELEPIVEGSMQEELGQLAAQQETALVAQAMREEEGDASYLEGEVEQEEQEQDQSEMHMPSSPPVDTIVLEDPPESRHRSIESPRESVREESHRKSHRESHRESHQESHRDSHRESHHYLHDHASPPTRAISTVTLDEERRRRDEERLREIYGHTPPTHQEQPTSAQQGGSSAEYMQQQQQYHHRQTPPSPSAEAYARREERRNTSPQRRNESLTELLLAAFRVAMQDRRNVVIVVMSALVLALALRGGGIAVGGPQDAATFQMGSKNFDTPTVTVTERGSWGTSVSEAEDVATVLSSSTSAIVTAIAPVSVETASFEEPLPSPSPSSSSSSTSYSSSAAAATTEESMVEEAHQSSSEDPCSSEVDEAAMVNEPETVVSERIVRVVETVTEKMVETATVTETQIVQTVQTATVEAEIEAEIEAEVEAEVEAQEEEAKEELAEEQLIEQDAVDVNVDDFTTRQLIDGQHFDELEELEEKLVEGTEEVGEPFMEVVAGATVEGAETDVMEEL